MKKKPGRQRWEKRPPPRAVSILILNLIEINIINLMMLISIKFLILLIWPRAQPAAPPRPPPQPPPRARPLLPPRCAGTTLLAAAIHTAAASSRTAARADHTFDGPGRLGSCRAGRAAGVSVVPRSALPVAQGLLLGALRLQFPQGRFFPKQSVKIMKA